MHLLSRTFCYSACWYQFQFRVSISARNCLRNNLLQNNFFIFNIHATSRHFQRCNIYRWLITFQRFSLSSLSPQIHSLKLCTFFPSTFKLFPTNSLNRHHEKETTKTKFDFISTLFNLKLTFLKVISILQIICTSMNFNKLFWWNESENLHTKKKIWKKLTTFQRKRWRQKSLRYR